MAKNLSRYFPKPELEKLPSPEFPKMSAKVKSVIQFGAIPDDAGDDTIAIQKAIDMCEEVFFPLGEYLISDTLRLKPHTKLFGKHPATIVLRTDSPKFKTLSILNRCSKPLTIEKAP